MLGGPTCGSSSGSAGQKWKELSHAHESFILDLTGCKLAVTIIFHMIQMGKKPTIMMSMVCSMAWSMIAVVAMNLGRIKIE